MKNLSVFQVTLLAIFSAFAVSGVLIFALVIGGNSGNKIGPVVVWGTLDASPINVALRQAAEDDPRLAQVSYEQKDPVLFANALTEALAGGAGPDIFLLRQDYAMRDTPKARIIPYEFISQTEFKNTFVEAAAPYLIPEGILGIPLSIDPMVMYWNRDLLSSAGYAEPPKYWDEIADLVGRVVKKDENGTIRKAAVAFGEYQNVDYAKDILALLILQAGGSITQRDATGHVVPSLAVRTTGPQQATESALRFFTEFADPSKVDYSWNRSLPSSRAAFAAGDLALYFGYASEHAGITRTNPNLNYAVAPIPQRRKDAASHTPDITIARVYALTTSRTARNPQSAITTASIVGGKSVSQAISTALGIPSARRDILAAPAQDEDEIFRREALVARSWIDPEPDKTATIFRAMIEGVTTGAARLTEAIGRASQELAQVLGQ